MDSAHMAAHMMVLDGQAAEGGVWLRGEYAVLEGPAWGWRMEFRQVSRNRLMIRSYTVPPEGEEVLGIETVLERVG